MTLVDLQRELRVLKICAFVSTTVAIVALSASLGGAQTKKTRFTEIDAERINVVDPDGRLALVLANTQRLPGPMIAGKELAKELSAGRTGSAGLIFVDREGNEIGGLVYGAAVKPDGTVTADSSLTFDQHHQDQVVGIQYEQDGSKRSYGLSVWDRPSKVSIAEMLEASKGERDRDARHRQFAALLQARGDVSGARRVFLGSQDRTAALRIMDPSGRERIRLSVDDGGAARLEFLDEHGTVVAAMPEARR